ncbi:hypothetical protein K439DRAFT_1635908 [Ramaria rubella]|nr:hypothetical protein K439DRAFT_1635908 [Ramaria rubella]
MAATKTVTVSSPSIVMAGCDSSLPGPVRKLQVGSKSSPLGAVAELSASEHSDADADFNLKMEHTLQRFIDVRHNTHALEDKLEKKCLAIRKLEDELQLEHQCRRSIEDKLAQSCQEFCELEDKALIKVIQTVVSQIKPEDLYEIHNQEEDPELRLEGLVDQVRVDIAIRRVQSSGESFTPEFLFAEKRKVEQEVALNGKEKKKRGKGGKKYKSQEEE